MSQNYEMMYILRPDLAEDQVNQIIDKYRNILVDHKAQDIVIQNQTAKQVSGYIKKLFQMLTIMLIIFSSLIHPCIREINTSNIVYNSR